MPFDNGDIPCPSELDPPYLIALNYDGYLFYTTMPRKTEALLYIILEIFNTYQDFLIGFF